MGTVRCQRLVFSVQQSELQHPCSLSKLWWAVSLLLCLTMQSQGRRNHKPWCGGVDEDLVYSEVLFYWLRYRPHHCSCYFFHVISANSSFIASLQGYGCQSPITKLVRYLWFLNGESSQCEFGQGRVASVSMETMQSIIFFS